MESIEISSSFHWQVESSLEWAKPGSVPCTRVQARPSLQAVLGPGRILADVSGPGFLASLVGRWKATHAAAAVAQCTHRA